MATRIIPVFMRDDQHEAVQIGSAKYNEDRGHFTLRVDIDTLRGEHYLFGKAIELGIVDGFHLAVIPAQHFAEQVDEEIRSEIEAEGPVE